MNVFETTDFKVFEPHVINGVTYYFVGRNKVGSGYMMSYTTKNDAIQACKTLQNAYNVGTLIM